MNLPMAKDIILQLRLRKLSGEGGWYRETHRSEDRVDPGAVLWKHEDGEHNGIRFLYTAIDYMLTRLDLSMPHSILSDEIWQFAGGQPLEMHLLSPEGKYEKHILGNPWDGMEARVLVPRGWIQATRLLGRETQPEGVWGLAGCYVTPGFDFADWKLTPRQALEDGFPEEVISQFFEPQELEEEDF